MTPKFQAGVSASMQSLHIYKIGDDPKMALCNSTVVVRNYRGPLDLENAKLCKRCFKLCMNTLPKEGFITASYIGVSEIV